MPKTTVSGIIARLLIPTDTFGISIMVICIGSFATRNCELRQARKGATVAVDSGAGMWLVEIATFNSPSAIQF